MSLHENERPSPPGLQGSAHRPAEPEILDPRTAARRRSRLERRIANLEHDIERAATANLPGSHWRKRIDEINGALADAQRDLASIGKPLKRHEAVVLPATPITAVEITDAIPLTVRFSIGDHAFRYSEEIDWAERGEQRSIPGLHRFEGDPEALTPDSAPADRVSELQEHLRHALGAFAIALCDGALQPPIKMTLADLATPCPSCGNWRDHRGRCINCQRRAWQANEMQREIDRLLDERNILLDDMAKQREGLPILQRQLQDARRELEKYIPD